MFLKRSASKQSIWIMVIASLWCLVTVFLTPLVLQMLWAFVLWEQIIDLGLGLVLFFLWLFMQWLYKHSTHGSYWLLGILGAMVLGTFLALI